MNTELERMWRNCKYGRGDCLQRLMKLMDNVGHCSRYPSPDMNSAAVEQEALRQITLLATLCRRHQNVQLTSDLYSLSNVFESPQGH